MKYPRRSVSDCLRSCALGTSKLVDAQEEFDRRCGSSNPTEREISREALRELTHLIFHAVLGVIVVLAVLIPSCSAVLARQLTREEVYNKAARSTVYLVAHGGGTTRANGFFVGADLVIAPLYFVKDGIEAGGEAEVTLIGQEDKYPVREVLARDEPHGLALLVVPGTKAPPLSVVNSDGVKAGSTAYILGNRLFKVGTISRDGNHPGKIILNAIVSPGNAGSPILNAQGDAIAISVGGMNNGRYLAIPVSDLRELLSAAKITIR